MTLPSCENDAKTMRDLAEAAGYDALILVNEEATTNKFLAFLHSSASSLFAGDCLLITFSGHGSQLPNTSGDNEADLMDETLCFYDRMLVDDELYALLSDLRDGVRVHVVFDSCHSGTALKQILVSPDENPEQQRTQYIKDVEAAMDKTLPFTGLARSDSDELNEELIPIKASSLGEALDGERPEFVDPPRSDADENKEIVTLFGDLYASGTFGKVKFLEGEQVYEGNRVLYDVVKDIVASKEDVELACTVTSLSACADSQTTPAGNPLSLFTFNLSQTWSDGGFRGSYFQFLSALKNYARQDVTPQLNAYGSGGSEARLYERPFMF
jgi:hypothetical protein